MLGIPNDVIDATELELLPVDGRSLGELMMAEFRSRYFISGEINSEVDGPAAKMAEILQLARAGEDRLR